MSQRVIIPAILINPQLLVSGPCLPHVSHFFCWLLPGFPSDLSRPRPTDHPPLINPSPANRPANRPAKLATADSDAGASKTDSPESQPSEVLETAEEVEASLAAQIDEIFGSYVVSPFATVLFFDFYTGPRTKEVTDEFGNTVLDQATGAPLKEITRQGWLRTEANPDGISIPFVVVWLLAGAVFLTLRMGFINIRAFKHAIDLTRGLYDKPGETG